MFYIITQFKKVNAHQVGASNIDMKRLATATSQLRAMKALARIMNKNRIKAFVRVDRGVLYNTIAYADLNADGGIVRFRKPDGFHFTAAIPLSTFRRRLKLNG